MLDWELDQNYGGSPEMERRDFCESLPLLSPREIDHLIVRHGYIGQDEQRQAIALMAYRHIRRLKRLYVERIGRHKLAPKQNTLLVGPTGCGKTFVIELLFQQIFQIPTVVIDITSFTESGYVGESVPTILARLVDATEGEPHLASCGIICLDEFDKLAASSSNTRFAGQGTTKDVSGYGVQRELLKVIEGADMLVPMDHGFSEFGARMPLSSRDIPFIACGVFPGLIDASQKGVRKIGFAKESQEVDAAPQLTAEDFQKFGFLPELIGRFSRILQFVALDKESLLEILRQNVLPKYVAEFRSEGIRLTITNRALDHIASEAQHRQTGARGLEAELLETLERAAYETFLEHNILNGGDVEVKVALRSGRLKAEVHD